MARPGSLFALVVAFALAACSAPGAGPAPEARTTLTGTYFGDPSLLPMAVSLLVAEPGVATWALASAQVVELVPGVHAIATTVVPASGAFTVDLPFASELPDVLRVPAPDAIGGELPAGCTIAVSNATVRVTPFEIASTLGPNLVGGFTDAGPRALILTPTPVNWADPGLDTLTLLGWVHADAPVSFATSGTCADASLDLVVDLDLERGWNRIGMRIDGLGGGLRRVTIAIDDGELLVIGPLGG